MSVNWDADDTRQRTDLKIQRNQRPHGATPTPVLESKPPFRSSKTNRPRLRAGRLLREKLIPHSGGLFWPGASYSLSTKTESGLVHTCDGMRKDMGSFPSKSKPRATYKPSTDRHFNHMRPSIAPQNSLRTTGISSQSHSGALVGSAAAKKVLCRRMISIAPGAPDTGTPRRAPASPLWPVTS